MVGSEVENAANGSGDDKTDNNKRGFWKKTLSVASSVSKVAWKATKVAAVGFAAWWVYQSQQKGK